MGLPATSADAAAGTSGSHVVGPAAKPPIDLLPAPGEVYYGGYTVVGADGSVYPYYATTVGSLAGTHLAKPVVGIAEAPDSQGFNLVAADGGVFSFGDATFHGSAGGLPLASPVVGIATDPATGGYWIVGADGGVFSYDAPFYGSTGAIHLAKPVVGIAATPDGGGYYLVASDGGIFAFGDAAFAGSTGNIALNQPVVGMSVDPATGGYWLDASDGGVFAFNAPFHGSLGYLTLASPVVGMAATVDGDGYWMVASDGGIFAEGDAPFRGSTGGQPIPAPIVGMAAAPDPGPQITTASLPAATVGAAYNTTLTAIGGAPPYTWTVTGLPAGLTFSPAGVISGTPTTAGSSGVDVTVSDTSGQPAGELLHLTVNPSRLSSSQPDVPRP